MSVGMHTWNDDAEYYGLTPVEKRRWLMRLSSYHRRRMVFHASEAVRLSQRSGKLFTVMSVLTAISAVLLAISMIIQILA